MDDWPAWASPTPGVIYRHYDRDGALLYVGSSGGPRFALRQDEHAKGARWWPYVARIDREDKPDRRTAYLAECAAVRAERPIFNRLRGRMIPWQQEREARYVQDQLGAACCHLCEVSR